MEALSENYYIPSIEEFHIGFDYELYIGNQWKKFTLSVDDTFYHTRIKFPVHIIEYIRMGYCRRLKTSKCSLCGNAK